MKFSKKKFVNLLIKGSDKFLSFMTKPQTQKAIMFFGLVFFTTINALAAGEGNAGFSSATTTIRGYQAQVSALMKAIGAIIAIVGAFNVFFKMQNGDQDVKKTIMLTIGGCVAFVALGEALPMFFPE